MYLDLNFFFVNLDNDFRSTRYSTLNYRNYHPKSRSLDVGMESVGLSDDEEGKMLSYIKYEIWFITLVICNTKRL